MTMRQLRQQIARNSKPDTTRGPRELPSSPDGAARALAGNHKEAYVLACRYCGGPLLADADGGWTCPRRDRHVIHGQTCEKKPHTNPNGGYLHGEDDDTPYDVDGWKYCGRCHRAI